MHDPYQPTCAGSFRGKGSKASAWSDSRPAESGKSAVCFRFFSVVLPLRKVAKQTAWTTRAVQIAVLHDAHAVYPDAVDADRVGGEARVAEHAADRLLVGVEEQRREHRVETLLERQVEHEVERVLARLSGQLGDRALLEVLARRLDHAHLAPLAVEQAEVRGGRKLLAN